MTKVNYVDLRDHFVGRCPSGKTFNGAGYRRALALVPAVLGTGPAPEGDAAEVCRVAAVVAAYTTGARPKLIAKLLGFGPERDVRAAMTLLGVRGASRIKEFNTP